MAYSDPIRIATPTIEQIASLIDGQLLDAAFYGKAGGTIISTTSTSLVQLGVAEAALTVPDSNCLVLCIATASLSNSSAAGQVRMDISIDSTSVSGGNFAYHTQQDAGSSAGRSNTISLFQAFTPSAGAHTFRILWAASSGLAAYSESHYLAALLFRQ